MIGPDPGLAADVLTKVVEIMASDPVQPDRRPQIAEMAREEERLVVRVWPYATFETPPRHVHKTSDIDTLTHFTSNPLAW